MTHQHDCNPIMIRFKLRMKLQPYLNYYYKSTTSVPDYNRRIRFPTFSLENGGVGASSSLHKYIYSRDGGHEYMLRRKKANNIPHLHTDPVVVRFGLAIFVIHEAMSDVARGAGLLNVTKFPSKTSEWGGSVHSASSEPTLSTTLTDRQLRDRDSNNANKKCWCGVHRDGKKCPGHETIVCV